MKSARYWLPAVLWTGVVLYASTDTFSAENTGSLLEAIAAALFRHVDVRILGVAHFLIRKTAHLTEYGILSLLWFRAWRGGHAGFRSQWAAAGIMLALATAIADEVHQTYVPSRTGEFRDIILDLTGALLAQLVLWMVIRWRMRRVENARSLDLG